MRTTTFVTALLLLLSGLALPAAGSEDEDTEGEIPCDPYPIGRCGEYPREPAIFCFVIENGRYVSATDDEAVGLIDANDHAGQETGLPPVDDARYYLRTAPAEEFITDPLNAPSPFGTLFEETNFVAGLQPEAFACGKWTWFPECVPQQWMGPTGVVAMEADQRYL